MTQTFLSIHPSIPPCDGGNSLHSAVVMFIFFLQLPIMHRNINFPSRSKYSNWSIVKDLVFGRQCTCVPQSSNILALQGQVAKLSYAGRRGRRRERERDHSTGNYSLKWQQKDEAEASQEPPTAAPYTSSFIFLFTERISEIFIFQLNFLSSYLTNHFASNLKILNRLRWFIMDNWNMVIYVPKTNG